LTGAVLAVVDESSSNVGDHPNGRRLQSYRNFVFAAPSERSTDAARRQIFYPAISCQPTFNKRRNNKTVTCTHKIALMGAIPDLLQHNEVLDF
jgi:hypothetical protein